MTDIMPDFPEDDPAPTEIRVTMSAWATVKMGATIGLAAGVSMAVVYAVIVLAYFFHAEEIGRFLRRVLR